VAESVAALARGLELFAARRKAAPLRVPAKRAEALGKLGIGSVQDLLQHYPRLHVDRSQLRTIAQLRDEAVAGEGRCRSTHGCSR